MVAAHSARQQQHTQQHTRHPLEPTVTHVTHDGADLYIGRTMRNGLRDQGWGNPYKQRDARGRSPVVQYAEYVRRKPQLVQRIKDGELDGKRLGCWCKPKYDCHGDALVVLWRELRLPILRIQAQAHDDADEARFAGVQQLASASASVALFQAPDESLVELYAASETTEQRAVLRGALLPTLRLYAAWLLGKRRAPDYHAHGDAVIYASPEGLRHYLLYDMRRERSHATGLHVVQPPMAAYAWWRCLHDDERDALTRLAREGMTMTENRRAC